MFELTLNTASIIRVTFSLTESLSMSARIGITLNLQKKDTSSYTVIIIIVLMILNIYISSTYNQ